MNRPVFTQASVYYNNVLFKYCTTKKQSKRHSEEAFCVAKLKSMQIKVTFICLNDILTQIEDLTNYSKKEVSHLFFKLWLTPRLPSSRHYGYTNIDHVVSLALDLINKSKLTKLK